VRLQAILHGRWGVVSASEHQEILVALASLIRAQRYEMALTILKNELTLRQADSPFTASHHVLELTTSQGRWFCSQCRDSHRLGS